MRINDTIAKCFKSYKYHFMALLLANILSMTVIILNTHCVGEYVDFLMKKEGHIDLIFYAILLISFNIIIIIFEIFNGYFLTKLQTKIVFKINFSMLNHIKMLPLDYFSDKDSFYINQRINSDSNVIVSFFSLAYIKIITSSVSLFVLFYLLLKLNLYSAVFITICIGFFLFFYNILKKQLYKKTLIFKEAQNRLFSIMGKQMNNMEYIKLNVLYKELDKNLLQAFPPFFRKTLEFLKTNVLFSSSFSIVNCIYTIFLYIYIGGGVLKGRLSIGEFLVIQGYFNMVMTRISELANVMKQYPDAKVSYYRLVEILSIEKEKNGKRKLNRIRTIKFEKVGIKFNNHRIFENLSFVMEQGRIYLIDGQNGAGKTTLMKCMFGLYPEKIEGNIYYNNIDINKLNMYAIRREKLSLVDQESEFFFDSINENLKTIGKFYDKKKLMYYLKKFNFSISGEKMKCNSQNALSGGERQKLSIIKAFLKSPDILFLDEPSSALDENSVNVLKQEIINLKNNRIIIIISHDNRIRDIVDEIVTI